jgi:large subunit ribosomal protein L13
LAKQETVVRTDVPIVVDATNHIAGRLASNVAKLLTQGNRVSVVNCEKIMLSGTRANHIKESRDFLKINSVIHPRHGPVHYRRPDTIMAKMIRGMLPYGKKPSGIESHKRLRTYIGSPKEIKSLTKIQFEKAIIKKTASNYTSIGELCKIIGWTE